jgi:hypothetical protein
LAIPVGEGWPNPVGRERAIPAGGERMIPAGGERTMSAGGGQTTPARRGWRGGCGGRTAPRCGGWPRGTRIAAPRCWRQRRCDAPPLRYLAPPPPPWVFGTANPHLPLSGAAPFPTPALAFGAAPSPLISGAPLLLYSGAIPLPPPPPPAFPLPVSSQVLSYTPPIRFTAHHVTAPPARNPPSDIYPTFCPLSPLPPTLVDTGP